MTTHDAFDVELRATLRALLDEASGPHPSWVGSPAREAVERRGGRNGTRRWPLRLLAVAALLAIGGGSALLVGSQRANERDLVLATGPIPERLLGEWVLDLSGDPGVRLDVGGPVLLPDVNGNGVSQRATGYIPIEADRGVLVVGGTAQCPEARYPVTGLATGVLRFAPTFDGCPGAATLTSRPWTKHRVLIAESPPPGTRQGSLAFTEPFHFTVAPPPDLGVWLDQGTALGQLSIGNAYWRGYFLDDLALYRDMTDPAAGVLADLPGTAAELEAWLRANGKLGGSAPVELTIDGRTAVRFDTVEQTFAEWPAVRDASNRVANLGVAHRFYLIPTGDDTIVFLVRGDTLDEEDWAEELLRTITFD